MHREGGGCGEWMVPCCLACGSVSAGLAVPYLLAWWFRVCWLGGSVVVLA